jgi:DNA polymerase I-like protein with 3'-5' exonuclease and polymerase domains
MALSGKLPNIRPMYRAEPGNLLVEADFDKQELRVRAVIAQDDVLQEALNRGDVYSETARSVFGLPLDFNVKKEAPAKRQACKIGELSRQYRTGFKTFFVAMLEEDRRLSVDVARRIYNGFDKRYPQTVKYWTDEEERVTATGYSEDWIPPLRRIVYPKPPEVSKIANSPIQMTAAKMTQLAKLEVEEEFAKLRGDTEFDPYLAHVQQVQAPKEARRFPRLVLDLHDALIAETPRELLDATVAVMKACMERFRKWKDGVERSFPVEVKVSEAWGEE